MQLSFGLCFSCEADVDLSQLHEARAMLSCPEQTLRARHFSSVFLAGHRLRNLLCSGDFVTHSLTLQDILVD